MNCPNCGASPEAAGLAGDRIERWHCPACNLDYEIDWSPAYEVPGVEEQTAKWWLISEADVQALREIMVGDGQSRAALYILETGLHETDAVPADFAPPKPSLPGHAHGCICAICGGIGETREAIKHNLTCPAWHS